MKKYAFLSIVMVLPQILFANKSFTTKDLLKVKTVLDAKVSPGGNLIAYRIYYHRDLSNEKDGPMWIDLMITDKKGHSRKFISKTFITYYEWSKDSKFIYFLAKRDKEKKSSIYRIAVDGGEAEKIVEFDTSIRGFSLSPDGKEIAFIATEKDGKEEKRLKKLGFNQKIFEEDWKFNKLFIKSLDKKNESPRKLPLEQHVSTVKWSPSGDKLVITTTPTPAIDDQYVAQKIVVISKDGKTIVKIPNEGKLDQIEWSPSGKRIAFISGENINDPAPGRLMVASLNGEVKNILPDFEGHVSRIRWINERRIVYLADWRVYTKIATIDIETGQEELIYEPASPPVFVDLTFAKGTIVLVGESPYHPREVFIMEKNKPIRITNSNEWLSDKKLAKQEYITYKARDGLEIDALLVYPLEYKKGKRYPMVIVVHGGPEAHFRNGWLTRYANPAQPLASRGFFVFFPNYRGSTGRGVAFTKLHQGDGGGKEFDDIVDGKEYLVRKGLVDRNKVGITGGSYGGYATAWGATALSEHYRAGVMFVGISNQISKTGTTDIPKEMYYVHWRKYPWEDWQFFLERSPIYHIKNARTPLLILHGDKDPRVHPEQSLEMYRYLKLYGKVPVRLVFYPGEKHGNRRTASRIDLALRLIRWMEHFVLNDQKELPPYEIDYYKELDLKIAEDDEESTSE